MHSKYRIGIDVGGTFTDGVMIDESTGNVFYTKVLSTPKDPSIGFLNNLDSIIDQSEVSNEDIWLMVHGTTVATNSIIEGKIAKAALITTKGFKDILEIAYQIRPKLYDLFTEKPAPLIPRDLCYEVFERIGPDGEVIETLREDEIYNIIQQIKDNNIESVAVCFLHSYINDSHEQRIYNILKKELPDLAITLSSKISPEFREYPRASTSVINAVIRPIVSKYVDKIEEGLNKRNIKCGFYLMQSNGGVISSEDSKIEPARIIESGPAAGVIIASFILKLSEYKNAICLDIGGTTAKMGIIIDGQPKISRELEVGSAAFSRSTATRASGYPLRTPSIDLVEIGAGGGSLAWIDSGGILRVGPQSAGADPGPACYPEGGEKPTITDANLVLGRLNPDYFLGGKMKLRYSEAVNAIKNHCSDKLKISVTRTALGIINLAVSNMVNAIRFISVEKGYDPREFCLVATGGAGPLHANLIADELKIPNIIVPLNPGVASGLGLLISDIKHEVSKTVLTLKQLNDDEAGKIFKNLRDEANAKIEKQGVGKENVKIIYSADMRYSGQSYELNVQIDDNLINNIKIKNIKELFHKEHERTYGFINQNHKVEIVNLRVIVLGKLAEYKPKIIQGGGPKPDQSACKESRKVYFDTSEENNICEIYDRTKLLQNNIIYGPAIVEEIDSSTVILPEYMARVDKWGNLLISLIE